MEIDYLVVGQGVAGTLLTHFLKQKNCAVHVVDQEHKGSSSAIAAGIMNPVTGKRVVKSWRVEDFFPFAKATYQELEQVLGVEIYHERPILRELKNNDEENRWFTRSALPDFQPYLFTAPDTHNLEEVVKPVRMLGEIRGGGNALLPVLIEAYRDLLIKNQEITLEAFAHDNITYSDGCVLYKQFKAKKIVFCEGHAGRFNPFFAYLPFEVNKGERMIIEIPEVQLDFLFKKGLLFLVPWNNPHQYWVGSTYVWEFEDDGPSQESYHEIIRNLENTLKVPYEILDHNGAIRPSVKDRRPLLGVHPKHQKLAIFNGLGTKGASLGPFWANAMVDHLVDGAPLDEEVNIQRYQEKMK